MKLAVATILLAIFLIGGHAAPQTFDFAGMKGLVDTTSIVNGEKTEGGQDVSRAAEEIIKSMIHKHLANKKSAKKASRKEKAVVKEAPAPVPAPVEQPAVPAKVSAINWEEHQESRTLLNEKFPGGTGAVDELIKLLQEQQAKQ